MAAPGEVTRAVASFPSTAFFRACLCNLANANPENRAEKVADVFLASEMKQGPKRLPKIANLQPKRKPFLSRRTSSLNLPVDYSSDELFVTYNSRCRKRKIVSSENTKWLVRRIPAIHKALGASPHRKGSVSRGRGRNYRHVFPRSEGRGERVLCWEWAAPVGSRSKRK